MAAYTYKFVRALLPQYIKEQVIDYDGSCDYDGDQWTAAEYYIKALENELAKQYENSKFMSDKELFTWLSTRVKTEYCDGPVIKIDNSQS